MKKQRYWAGFKDGIMQLRNSNNSSDDPLYLPWIFIRKFQAKLFFEDVREVEIKIVKKKKR